MLASQAGMAQPAPDVSELVKRVGERFFALENFDVELKIGNLGDHPMERRMRMARRDDGSMLLDTKTGYVTIVRDGRLIRIRDRYKEWTETAAEGPPMRSLKRTFEPYVTRFEKLAAVDFEIEFVKWQELKRGARRVKCAVVRMWPRRQADGIWKETLWIEPDEALVWRSLMEQPQLLDSRGTRVSQVDYEWRATAGPIGDGVFDSVKLKKYRKVDQFTFRPGMGASLPSKVGP
jgi:hypothetical protein